MGELFEKLLEVLQACAKRLNIDIVICCWEHVNFNMLQSLRVQSGLLASFSAMESTAGWEDKKVCLFCRISQGASHNKFVSKEKAEELAQLAVAGKLVGNSRTTLKR